MKRILVIEDNQEVRENIVEILSLSDYEVDSAENGIVGVEKAQTGNPDLILCDVMMPDLDGFGVLKILGKKAATQNIPFIFLTAKAEKTDFRKGMGLGADDYITKPFDDTDLLDAIEMRLKKVDQKVGSFSVNTKGLQRFFSDERALAEFNKLKEDKEVRKYNVKDLIYEINGVPRWLFLVKSGRVKTYKTNDFGKNLITHVYNAGDLFGYIPCFQESNYADSASALSDSELILIPFDEFKVMLFNNPDLISRFIKTLASEISAIDQSLIELAYSSVRKKVASALLLMGEGEENIVNISRHTCPK